MRSKDRKFVNVRLVKYEPGGEDWKNVKGLSYRFTSVIKIIFHDKLSR